MSDRGLTLLTLVTLPVESAAREHAWRALAAMRPLRSNLALVRDYHRRRLITTPDYRTAVLTEAGQDRKARGDQWRAEHR